MKKIATAAACLMLMAPSAAFADEKPSADEMTKINETLAAWGCSGGTAEKESEAGGVYEIDDAKCKTGQYDLKLDKDFTLTTLSRD